VGVAKGWKAFETYGVVGGILEERVVNATILCVFRVSTIYLVLFHFCAAMHRRSFQK
jgi:hypothetical protein